MVRSFFLLDAGYEDVVLNGQVELKQRGFQNYITIEGYNIWVDSESLMSPGWYEIDAQAYRFTRNNPNTFNYKRYILSKGYVDIVSSDSLKMIKKKESITYRLYRYLQDRIQMIYGPYSPLIKVMIIGDKSTLEGTESFVINGTMHVLAISGLHIGILYIVLKRLTFWMRYKYVTLVLLAGYILLIGYPVSAIRAFLMLCLVEVSNKYKRPYDMISALMAIGMFMFIYNPYSIFDIGLHYSFAAILVIGNFYKYFKPLKMDWLLLPLIIQVGMMPLTIYYNQQIHLLSFLLNILIIPLVSIVLNLGLFTLIFNFKLLIEFNKFICDLLYELNAFFSSFDHMIIELPALPMTLLITYFVILLCMYEKRYINKLKTITILILLFYSVYRLTVVEVFIFDVGQGDGILVKDGFNAYVIDGGKPTSDLYFRKLLLANGIRRVDYAFLTHSDSDHIGGLIDARDLIDKLIYQSPNEKNPNFNQLEELNAINMLSIQSMDLGRVEIEKVNYTVQEGNNASLVFYMTVFDTCMLFTGDIEACIEEEISFKLKEVDIVKVPHHGSSSSSTDAFVEALKPSQAVISVGFNAYGHPDQEVINRYLKYGHIYSTLDGCIKIVFTPFGYLIQSYDVSSLD